MTVRRHSVCLMSPPTLLILVLLGFEVIGGGRSSRLNRWESGIRMPTEKHDAEDVDGEVALDGLFLLLVHPVMEITGTRNFSFSLMVTCSRYNMVDFSITDENYFGLPRAICL